jgi:hypothetical protein
METSARHVGQLGVQQNNGLTRSSLRTPKAAAFAGIVFALLLGAIFWLLRNSIPADPLEPGAWLAHNSSAVSLALNLMPFAGVAFLWFVGVLRDRMGSMEDRFFATLFLGGALLFLAMLFSAAAIVGAIILTFSADPGGMSGSVAFHLARAVAYNLMNVYAIKMAGVFMISTSVVTLYAGFVPRWIAYLGFVLALALLLGGDYVSWSFLVLPVWVFLVGVCILIDSFRKAHRSPASSEEASPL